jgi:hypothetical protein
MEPVIVDGICYIGKLINVWPHNLENYTQVSAAEFDDIMKTIDYRMDTYSDCSTVEISKQISGYDKHRLGYIKGRDADALILLRNDFLARIKYEPPVVN